MREYIYYDHLNLQIPLHDHIEVLDKPNDESCLISNHQNINSQLVAPEIDFYLKNSLDDTFAKAENVTTLYEARATCFDYSQDSDYSQEVGKSILLVGEFEELKRVLKDDEYTAISLEPESIALISGHLGALNITIRHDDELLQIEADQIVWKNAPEFALLQSGVIDAKDEDAQALFEMIKAKTGTHKYKNFTTYDPSICQYHERREEICGKCADICPTVAIIKQDEDKHLKFSHIDCHGCGGCISVCPSGAIEYAQMPRMAFFEIAKLYHEKTALIIPRKMSLENLHVELPCGVVPFAIEGEKFLHEAHLLTLLQESGSAIIFYTDFISKGTGEVIDILNQIYQNIYGVKAIHVAMNEEELKEALSLAKTVPNSHFSIQSNGLAKREIFSERLRVMIGENDFGIVKSGEHVHYGTISVNQDKCTLCLSCVGACNVKALNAKADDNTLRFNASICTTCTYCELTCPEKAIEVKRGEIPLNKSWFHSHIMATDTLFECVVCHKPFATTKSVEKIASIMAPLFIGDEIKLKSLYCCADCKPKLMFEHHLSQGESLIL